MTEYRASASVNLTFVASLPDGTEIPIDPETGLPVVQITMESDETTAAYGNKIFFRVFVSPSGTSYNLENSASQVGGRIYDEDSVDIPGVQKAEFNGSNIASLSPALEKSDVVSTRWIGNNLGAISINGNQVVSTRSGLGTLEIKYKRKYFGYSIVVPVQPETSFPVKVAAYVPG